MLLRKKQITNFLSSIP